MLSVDCFQVQKYLYMCWSRDTDSITRDWLVLWTKISETQ